MAVVHQWRVSIRKAGVHNMNAAGLEGIAVTGGCHTVPAYQIHFQAMPSMPAAFMLYTPAICYTRLL